MKKNFALCATINKYSNSCVDRKKIYERNKKSYPPPPPPPPLQVKWSVPYKMLDVFFSEYHCY